MAAVTLRKIDKTNYREIALLTNTLTDEQKLMVTDNGISILDAHYRFGEDHPDMIAEVRGIYADDEPVGLVLWAFDPAEAEKHWWVVRLMTAGTHQGKGIGRAALQQAIECVRELGADKLYIGFKPHNTVARHLYGSLGFVDTGEMQQGEVIYRLDLNA